LHRTVEHLSVVMGNIDLAIVALTNRNDVQAANLLALAKTGIHDLVKLLRTRELVVVKLKRNAKNK
jgi:hypothetical protein